MAAVRWFALFLLGIGALASTAQAQEGDPHQAFDAAWADYKQAISDIEQLRSDYLSADTAEREAIYKQLKELVAEVHQKVDRMTDTAFAAYKADPKKNPELADLLLERVKYLAAGEAPPKASGGRFQGGDQPEKALPIIAALIEGGVENPRLYIWGGVSAVNVNDFDLAKKYFDLATEHEAYTKIAQEQEEENSPELEYLMTAHSYSSSLEQLRKDWEVEAKIREAEAEADDLPRVKITTTKGDIVVELFENEAPQSTANFLTLVKQGYYDGLDFHRVLPGFMAQGGDNGKGPGYTIRCECYQPGYRKHFRGTLSMAKPAFPERDSGGAQFFLCFVPTRHLDGKHTAFARVVEGMEVLGQLQKINPSAPGPFPEPDKIVKAEVLRDRGHAYDFEKIPAR